MEVLDSTKERRDGAALIDGLLHQRNKARDMTTTTSNGVNAHGTSTTQICGSNSIDGILLSSMPEPKDIPNERLIMS